MSHFEDIKKKLTTRSMNDFINGANKDQAAYKSRKKVNKDHILLSVTGKINRENCGKPMLLYLQQDVENEIEKHCLGSKQAIINYLVKKGLDSLKEKEEFILENLS